MKIAIITIASLLVVGVGVWLLWPDMDSQESMTSQTPISEQPSTGRDKNTLVIGNNKAPVTLVEYADFKCPNCAKFHQQAGQGVRQDYVDTGGVKLDFRGIAIIGPDSSRAAQGAYCANEQSKFTAYHDAVYNYMWNNFYKAGNYQAEFDNVLTTEKLVEIAAQQGMTKAAFTTCLNNEKYADTIQDNLDAAAEDGVRGTPTFIIGDQVVTGPQPYSVFQTLLDLELM